MPVEMTEMITETDLRVLWSATVEAAERFYQDPVNQRDFEEWLKTKNKK